MDYNRIYGALVAKAQSRRIPDGYTEKHHIIPRSLGGSNDSSNLVILTAREHLVAHLLLAKIHGGGMIHAAYWMTNAKRYNSRQYAWLREQHADLMRIRGTSHMLTPDAIEKKRQKRLGTKLSDETKQKISLARAGVLLSEEHKQKIAEAGKSRIQTEATKQKIREANIGKVYSEETLLKMSESSKGKTHSEETKRKMSEKRQGCVISDETKRKISEAKRGKPRDEETRRKISEARKGKPSTNGKKISIDGVIYKSFADAEQSIGLSKPTIRKRIRDTNYPNWFYL